MQATLQPNQDLLNRLANLEKQFLDQKNSSYSLNNRELEQIRTNPNYFVGMHPDQFEACLTYVVNIFIKKFDLYERDLKELIVNQLSHLQRRAFILKLSSQILFLDEPSRHKHINNLFSFINLDQLKEAVKITSPKAIQWDAVFSLAILMNAALSIDKEGTESDGFWHQIEEKGKELCDFVTDSFHQLLQAFEILDQSPTNAQDSLSYLSGQMIILQHMQVLAPAVALVFPAIIPALLLIPTVGAVARKIYCNWILSSPISLPPLECYSNIESSSSSRKVIGRERLFNKIIKIWKKEKHPILVGEPGSGKSTFLAELGRRIALVQLKGFSEKAVVFGGSAFSVVEGDNTEIFQRVVKTAAVYDEVILAFDEAHAFESKQAMNLLKSSLDHSKGSLRYAIFATTPAGYDQLYANDTDGALGRRMQRIDLEILNKEQMSFVIKNEAREIAPLLQLTESAEKAIYDRAGGKMNESRQLLHKVLHKAETQNAESKAKDELDKKDTELSLYRSSLRDDLLNGKPAEAHKLQKQIYEVQKIISVLKDQSLDRELAVKNHEHLCVQAGEIKDKIIRLSQEIYQTFRVRFDDTFEELSGEEQFRKFDNYLRQTDLNDLISEFLFYSYFYGISLTKKLEEIEAENGFIRLIDDQFVGQVE